MSLQEALLEIQPDAALVDLPFEAYHFRLEVPAFTDDRVFVPINDQQAYLINARSGFTLEFVGPLVDCVLRAGYAPRNDGAISLIDSQVGGFDNAVCVPPPTPRQFTTQSPGLAAVTTWILPAYNCEFRNGQSGDEFYYAAFKHPKIPVLDWGRNPEPQLRVQLLTEWTGGMYRKVKKPFVDSVLSISTAARAIPHGVSFRMIDLRNRELIINRVNDRIEYQLTEGTDQSSGSIARDDAPSLVRAFGLGSVLS
ncbi:hypothetical protein SH528x_001676 [Novipirellula sp. SH528]|uniref:hypothetical protein n=1 Tax=Novipirellula sp. SH528 TaxID=3454466 RepID=UPI003FA0182C